MGSIPVFDGTSDVVNWASMVRAKLVAKGYKSQLLDNNRPGVNDQTRAAWDAQADKATGVILTYLEPEIAVQVEAMLTPQTLLHAIIAHYRPDQRQEVDRLESELMELAYDGTDPVIWCAKVRGLVTKLTAKQAAPTERTVRTLVLKALEQEPEYKIRVEVIRHSQPDITLVDLWTVIGRLSYPLKKEEGLLLATQKLSLTSRGRGRGQKGQSHSHSQKNCYDCGKKGHLSYQCPNKKDTEEDDDEPSSKNEKEGKGKEKQKPKFHHYSYFAQVVQKEAVSAISLKEQASTNQAEVEVEFAGPYFSN